MNEHSKKLFDFLQTRFPEGNETVFKILLEARLQGNAARQGGELIETVDTLSETTANAFENEFSRYSESMLIQWLFGLMHQKEADILLAQAEGKAERPRFFDPPKKKKEPEEPQPPQKRLFKIVLDGCWGPPQSDMIFGKFMAYTKEEAKQMADEKGLKSTKGYRLKAVPYELKKLLPSSTRS